VRKRENEPKTGVGRVKGTTPNRKSGKQKKAAKTKAVLQVGRIAIRLLLASYYLGGAIKLGIVTYGQTGSYLYATMGGALLLAVSLMALFDLRVYPKSKQAVLWGIKLLVAFLYVQHLQSASPYLGMAILFAIDALAHLLSEHLR